MRDQARTTQSQASDYDPGPGAAPMASPFDYVQIPLGEPHPTLSENPVSDNVRWDTDKSADLVWSGLVGSGPCPCSGNGMVPTRLCRWSGRVVSKFHYTDPTRHVRVCDQVSDKDCSVSNSTIHGPTDLVCDPTRPDTRTKSVHVEIEQTKSADLSETQVVLGSGLVGSA